MIEKKRTAILFTANTPQLAHANLMIDSLRDADKGNFSGDLWVISTGLSDRAKNYCDSKDIKYFISGLFYLYKWKNWEKVAEAQPQYEELIKTQSREKSLEEAFETYRNKRMSKLVIIDWVNKFGNNYDFVALGDNDLYFQRDVHELFECAYENGKDKIHYWQEENEIVPGSWLWKKNFHFSRLYDVSEFDFGKYEINIGFIMGKPEIIGNAFKNVKNDFLNLNYELFIKNNWHDQDLIRLDRARFPSRYSLIEEGCIVHLCAGGDAVIEERYPKEFYHKRTGKMPYIIHFAGGLWKKYSSIKDTYMIEPDTYYFSNEIVNDFNTIRQGSSINIFDQVFDKYFTAENKASKITSRKKWIQLNDNGKKKLMFIGWLKTSTHKSTLDAIPGVFDNNLYDLVVLNGNVENINYENLVCEDFPVILAELTRITKDPFLIRTYGVPLSNVPEELFYDTVKSAMVEYHCTYRTALAVANLCYLYFADAISFYHPDLVMLWGYLSPWGKMIKNICNWKRVPICSLEWGILPGTAAFDFNGHMADSWVSEYSEFFNSLPIDGGDIKKARDYLRIAGNPKLSRNLPQNLQENMLEKVQMLKNSGKKIILYMESNSAHSGNTLYDEKRAKHHSPFYKDDKEAYAHMAMICKNHRDWHILYKPHPISITRGMEIEIKEESTTVLYDCGLMEALELADVSVTILSQSAYVSLIKQVPVIVLGNLQLLNSGAAYTIKGKDSLEDVCEEAVLKGYTESQQMFFEKHVARALKYYVFRANEEAVACRDSLMLAETLVDIMENRQDEYYKYERDAYCRQLKATEDGTGREPLVTIVMPVYNAAEYLSSCLDSICGQTFNSWELICINNGSTDDSQEILNYYAGRDARIRLHDQKEPNQRIARNWGYDHAKGKYLYLIDSDDYLDLNALETLVSIAEDKNADLLYFFFREVRTDMQTVRPRPRFYNYRKYFPKEKLFQLEKVYYKFFIQYPFPWAKLIRRDFVIKNSLYFDLDCSNFDDNPHNLRTLLAAKNPYVFNEQLYNFRIHENSMTQSKNARIYGMLDAVRIMNKIYEDHKVYSEFQRYFVPYKVHLLAWAWDLLPDDLREAYCIEAKNLFMPGDEEWFENDEMWSYYEIPSRQYVHRMKAMLDGGYKKVQESDCAMENHKAPWEKIGRGHLFAIQICEKLHIINWAIKIKALLRCNKQVQ